MPSKRTGEQTTWIIYNDPQNPTPQSEIDHYSELAKNSEINVKVVYDVEKITDYINNKNGGGSREKDKISRFYYLGHATPGDLDVGYDGSGQNFDPGDLNSSAFRSGAFVDVVGGCRTAISDKFLGIKIESSIVDKFRKILDKKSTVIGSNVRVYYSGGVVNNTQLLSKNKGKPIEKHGKL